MHLGAGEAIGREAEIQLIGSFLDGARAERALWLEGEAGIGKSALLGVAIELARERGYRVLACRAAAAETGFSLASLGDLLRPVADEVLPLLPDPQRQAVEAALGLGAAGGGADERLVGLALLSALRELARSDPVLLVVDDVQWLDSSSAAALRFAVRRLEEEPVRLAVAARADGQIPELENDLVDRLLRRTVGPLSMGALHRIVARWTGDTLARPVMRQVYTASGGNPFYALEIARFVAGEGDTLAPGERLPIPRTLEQLVRTRLGRLSAGAEELLELAALLAEPSPRVLKAAGAPLERLDEAVDAGVLDDDARFTHPLLAAGVVAGIGPTRRRELHARLAAVAPGLEERARHRALAADGPEEEVAALLDAAAEAAAERGAPAAAGELSELAVPLTTADDADRRRQRLLRAAQHHVRAGDLRRARFLLGPLVRELPLGEERAEALYLQATSSWDDFGSARTMLEEALAETAADARRARILLALTNLTAFDRGADRALLWARDALVAAELSGDEQLIRVATCRLAAYEVFVGEQTPGLVDRALHYAAAPITARDAEIAADGMLPAGELALALLCHNRFDDARRLFEQSSAAARELGLDLMLMQDLMHLVTLECRVGNWQLAAAHARECTEISEQVGSEFQGGLALYATALVAAHLGDAGEARATAERGAAISAEIGDSIFELLNQRVLGFVDLSEGNMQAAAERLEPLARFLKERGWREPSLSDVVPNVIEALVATGRMDKASEHLADLEEWGRRMDSPWARAVAGRYSGLMRSASGDVEGALAAFGEALREHELLTTPFERARTLVCLGVVQRRAKQKRAARESLTEALQIFEGLRAKLWVARARSELKRIGGRTRGGGELTETERRVAELAAAGRKNSEVAAELYISVRSVEWNLSKVYAKLGIRSRTELARSLPQ